MSAKKDLRLFIMHSAVLSKKVYRLKKSLPTYDVDDDFASEDVDFHKYESQYSEEIRKNARRMARYYMLFYMLENEIRNFVQEVLEEKASEDWWTSTVPDVIRTYAEKIKEKEYNEGVSNRSTKEIDYVTFGHISEIMLYNWDVFGGFLSSQRGVEKVLKSLNMLRGPIAHCSLLNDDEADRLLLALRDWSRVSSGPKA